MQDKPRHIIVEGCDGSGKDTLIRKLWTRRPDYRFHERASDSLTGPVKDLLEWVNNDLTTIADQPPSLYNRHPLISEHIYWRYRGDDGPRIDNADRVSRVLRLVPHVVVIICQPPMGRVVDTVRQQGRDAHMPGVYENIALLWQDYAQLVWPGRMIRYDYTRDTLESLPNLTDRMSY